MGSLTGRSDRLALADALCVGPMLLWAIYLLLAPTTGFWWIDSWHNEQRAAQLVLLAVNAIAFCACWWLAPAGHLPRPHAVAWALLALGLVSALRTEFPLAAFAEVGHFVLLALVVLASATFFGRDTAARMRWVQRFVVLLGAAYVVGVAVRYGAALELGRTLDTSIFVLGYANPRFPSALHTLMLPLIAARVVDGAERSSLRGAALVVLVLLVAVNLGLGTRAIWFAYAVVAAVVVLLAGWRKARSLCGVLGAAIAAGAVVYWLLFKLVGAMATGGEAIVAPTHNLTLTHRDVLWAMSWENILASPLLGIGPMQFAAIENHYGAHPHNWPLQIAAEWGLPAALLMLVLAAYLPIALRQRMSRGDQDAAPSLAFAFAALAALVVGLVDGNLIMPVSQSATALAFGACLRPVASAAPAAAPGRHRRAAGAIVATGAAIAALCVVCWFAVDSFPRQQSAAQRFQASYPGAWLLPRFWEHGLLVYRAQ